jgi:LysM repeat protein
VIFAVSERSISARRVACLSSIVVVALAGVLLLPLSRVAGATEIRVTPGETLTEIAREYGTTIAALEAANQLANPNHIIAGSELQIPGPAATSAPTSVPSGGTVPIAVGQNLSSIAAVHGTTVAELMALNGIENPNFIVAGGQLRLPGGSPAVSAPASAPSAPATSPVAPAGSLPAGLLAYPGRLALRPLFAQWAAAAGVPSALLQAMCWWESGWQSSVSSVTGAVGVCQLEPSTVSHLRAQLDSPGLDANVASDNIEMAAVYLHTLLSETGGDPSTALAGYYQGLASVRRVGLFPSTQIYVKGILAYVPAFS